MQKHFVMFYSPGTFIAETTELPIDEWDVDVAVEMARSVTERHGSRPYGFKFITRARGEEDLDSRVVKTSGMYFLGGRVETLEEIEARNDPSERILRTNMHNNGVKRIVINENSYKWTQPLRDGDVVLNVTL